MGKMPEVTSPERRDTSQPTGPHILTHSPAQAFVNLGTSCLREGRYDEARFYLRQSLRFQPDDRGTLNNLGAIAWAMGLTEEAEGYYRRALQLAPTIARSSTTWGTCFGTRTPLMRPPSFIDARSSSSTIPQEPG